jgi:hypothetical protein
MTRIAIPVIVLALAACERPEPVEAAPADVSTPAPPTAAPASAPRPAPAEHAPSAAAKPAPKPSGFTMSFDADEVGGPGSGIAAVIGDWLVDEHDGARGFMVDGTRWRNGTPSANLVDQARRLYGERYAEFLDGVKAFAFYPLAVVDEEPPTGDLRISVRFFPIAGRIDQAAGIAFSITPDGSYYGVRANPLEDNILFFRVVRGKRTILETIRNTPTPTRTWHTLEVELRGDVVHVELDDRVWLDETLPTIPHGRVGLWSKADSRVLFDDLRVESLSPSDAATEAGSVQPQRP